MTVKKATPKAMKMDGPPPDMPMMEMHDMRSGAMKKASMPKMRKPPPPGQMMDEKPMPANRPKPVMTKLTKGGKRK